MCDRSSDPTEHDAARERPSALDVCCYSFLGHDEREPHPTRLTEPDAGEGTERPHNHTIDGHHWHDCPGCDDGTPQHELLDWAWDEVLNNARPEGGPE